MRRAVALEPGLIMGHNLLAKIYIGQGRFAKAEGHLRKALELEQGSWEALIQLLFVLHRTGQLAPQGAGDAGGDVSQAICKRIRALLRQQGVREEPEALGLCAFFDPALWQRPLRADASVAARMRAHKYVALAEILPPDIVRALQAYYRKIIQTQYKVQRAPPPVVAVSRWARHLLETPRSRRRMLETPQSRRRDGDGCRHAAG